MYRGFKIGDVGFGDNQDSLIKKGRALYNDFENNTHKALRDFLLDDNSLDGSKIIESWFPQINANVFISHSHKDESKVLAFAGWLYTRFGIVSFIDSCIWGYGNKLIKILDDDYSWSTKEKKSYNYQKVLDSSSHVHMMLSTALNLMIDKTECLIFFNTPNSIEPYNKIDKTNSPWIYSEIAFSQIVRINVPLRHQHSFPEIKTFSTESDGRIDNARKIRYDIDSSHLVDIDKKTLIKWSGYPRVDKSEKALDQLYEITTPNKLPSRIIYG